MLFEIRVTRTIQLPACDFHKRYAEALKILLLKEMQDKHSLRYGHVIALNLDPKDIQPKPLLLTHQGVAAFKVSFTALVERVVPGEVAMARLAQIKLSGQEMFDLVFELGCLTLQSSVESALYLRNDSGEALELRLEM